MKLIAASPHQPRRKAPQSTLTRSPSPRRVPSGMPWTTASLTLAQITHGKGVVAHDGAALRDARGPATLVKVADAAGISVETLRKIETGRIPTPAFFTIVALARVLGLSLDTDLSLDTADRGAT